MRLDAGTDGTPGARAVSVVVTRGASMPLTEVSPPADVMREFENLAIAQLDALAARKLTDIDRRFNRASSALGSELARRQDAASETYRRRHPVTLDVWAFLFAAVSIGLLLAGGRSGPSVPTSGALIGASVLGVVAAGLHFVSSSRAAGSQQSGTQSWYLVMLTAVLLFASALAGYWRYGTDTDAGFLITALTIGTLISSGVFATVLVVRGAGARSAELRQRAARREREDALRADLRVQLGDLIAVCRVEAERVFSSLDPSARTALDAAVAAGVASVEKRGILETASIRELRTSSRGELRYDLPL
ncbi:hypothetical protein IWX78_001961 [Mycetocola sp. CAN_C7]|uniref:hypothetical protein n=1 Tax=Mycetocola sp. CAN_C7 TaxID=2787724 RepID=UPI0018C93F47